MECTLLQDSKTLSLFEEELQQEDEKTLIKLIKAFNLNQATILSPEKIHRFHKKKTHRYRDELTEFKREIICEFRRVTKLPIDDVLMSLKYKMRFLTRSKICYCLKKKGLHIIPDGNVKDKKRKKLKNNQVGYVYLDITELKIKEDKYYLFTAMDKFSKYLYIEIFDQKILTAAVAFLKNLIKDCPFKIQEIITNNIPLFTYRYMLEKVNKIHLFDLVCIQNNITHSLTEYSTVWINGQIEIPDKFIKNFNNLEQIKKYLSAFVSNYNFQRSLKSLKLKTPYQAISKCHAEKENLFWSKPIRAY